MPQITGAGIADGSISATKISAGTIVAGMVDGTVVQGATVIAYGNGTIPQGQLLIYSGYPALGNLIGSWSGAAGTDAQGNAFPQGLNVTVGAIAGTTFTGTDFIINSSGAFFYSGTPALGNLILSIAQTSGTDAFGNAYDAGFEVQGTGAYRVKGTSGQVISMLISGGIPFVNLSTGAAEEGTAANFQAFINSPGASENMVCFLAGPKGSVHNDQATILLESAAKDGSAGAEGALNWTDTSGGEHFWGIWNSKGLKTFSPLETSGFNTYQTERITAMLSVVVVINSATFAQFLNTWQLGVGQYHLHGQIVITATTINGTAKFEFAGGTSVVSYMGITFSEFEYGAPTAVGNSSLVQGFASAYTSATLNNTTSRFYTFDGVMNVTTAGTLGIFAATNGTGAFNIERIGTYMELNPIGP